MMTEAQDCSHIIRELVATLNDIRKQELSAMSQRHKHELEIREAYFNGFKKELLEQFTAQELKVIDLQKAPDAKSTAK